MSRIIASAAIRGAHKIASRAEKELERALEVYGPEQTIEFPNTAYFLPVIYAMTGMEVRTVGDMRDVMDKIKALLPPVPSEEMWLPYLGHTLDAGMATLFADEIIESINICKTQFHIIWKITVLPRGRISGLALQTISSSASAELSLWMEQHRGLLLLSVARLIMRSP